MTSDGGGAERECAGCGASFKPKSRRQKYHSTACRKKNAQRKKATPPKESPEERVVRWSVQYGAPVRLLEGWDPERGIWADGSPMFEVIAKVSRGVHVTVAGRQHGFKDMPELLYRGADYQSSEDRSLIPMDARPLVDLVEQIDFAEAGGESDLATHAYDKALTDPNPKHALDFLARRWPARWREQQAVTTAVEDDPREKAVTDLLSDPANALALAAIAEQVEDAVETEERERASREG